MKSPKNSPSSDSWDSLIRDALQEEISDAKAPCVWRRINREVYHLKGKRQVRWTFYTESVFPLSVRADMSYLILGPIFQQIQ